MTALLLGVDVGTTFCKAVVLDTGGTIVGRHREPTPWMRVDSGADVDPHALLRAALTAASGRLSGRPDGRVASVGSRGWPRPAC